MPDGRGCASVRQRRSARTTGDRGGHRGPPSGGREAGGKGQGTRASGSLRVGPDALAFVSREEVRLRESEEGLTARSPSTTFCGVSEDAARAEPNQGMGSRAEERGVRTGGLSGGEKPEGDGSTSLAARPPRVKNYPLMSGGQSVRDLLRTAGFCPSPMTLHHLHKFRAGESPSGGAF